MPIIRNALTLCAIAFIVSAAVAETDYSEYVQYKGGDKLNSTSWNSGGRWSDKTAPSADKNYYVPQGKELWFQRDSKDDTKRIWKGGKLAVAGILHMSVNASASYAPYIADLTLCAGGMVRASNYGTFSKNGNAIGVVNIEGTADAPSVISHHYPNTGMGSRAWHIYASFEGGRDNVLVLERPEINFEGAQCFPGELCYAEAGTFKEYSGTVRMQGSSMEMRPAKNTIFNWPNALLSVCGGASLNLFHKDSKVSAATTDAYLRALSVENASVCWKYAQSDTDDRVFPLVHLTEGFSMDSSSKVKVAATRYDLLCAIAKNNGMDRPDAFSIARIPSSVAIEEDAISSIAVAVTNSSENFLPVKLRVLNNVDGYKDIVLSSQDLAIMTNNASQSSSGGAFCAGHGNDWTNGEVPSSEGAKHYWLAKSTYITDDITLPESILTVANTFNCVGGEMYEFKEMNLCGGNMYFWSDANERKFKADKVHVHAEQTIATSIPYVIFDAEICGGGALILRNNDNGYGKIRLECENTNYSGRVVLTQQGPNADKDNITPYKFTFYMNKGCNLGGRYDGDDSYRAITFSKFPAISVQRNATLNEPTRGILIEEGVRLTTPSTITLTISNQVTYAGTVQKTGSGTLDLAGSARFIDGEAETLPEATTNVMEMTAGKLRISSKAAADGLEIRFAEGTKLLIPADTEAGYYNVKWDIPIVVDAESGKLPVVVEGLDATEVANVRVPVCTFNATAAATISADMFDVSTNVKGVRLKTVEKVANEDGSVSYVATFGRFGSRILFR